MGNGWDPSTNLGCFSWDLEGISWDLEGISWDYIYIYIIIYIYIVYIYIYYIPNQLNMIFGVFIGFHKSWGAHHTIQVDHDFVDFSIETTMVNLG